MTAHTWDIIDHVSVLIAAVFALPTVVAAMLAALFAKRSIADARIDHRQRQLAELITCVARWRRTIEAERRRDADEQANVIISLQLAVPLELPLTTLLGGADPLRGAPTVLLALADDSLDELRGELLRTKPARKQALRL